MSTKETTVNITIRVDASELDAAIEKAEHLKRTLEQDGAPSVRGLTIEIPSSSNRDTPREEGANTSPKT